ncbi:hypothetical protein [Celeribacter sp.]|uniref:hypothetical protein n=1 Tax=Celeribacter sp. TaxID=1890673 RepID=UPI003A92D465
MREMLPFINLWLVSIGTGNRPRILPAEPSRSATATAMTLHLFADFKCAFPRSVGKSLPASTSYLLF